MANGIYQVFTPSVRRMSACFLAFFFFEGFVFGSAAVLQMDQSLFPMMRRIQTLPVSIVTLIAAALFPFLISACALWIDPVFLLPICFVRAFLFAFAHLSFLGCYGFEGFALRWLMLFSDIVNLPVAYFFWHRRTLGHPMTPANILGTALLLSSIGLFDYYAVMPLRVCL